MRFSKLRAKTELQQLKENFPNYNTTKLNAEYDMQGNIISIETTNPGLKAALLAMGFIQE